MLTRRTLLKTVGLAALGATGGASYAFAIEPRFRLVVTRYRLDLPHWPASGAPRAPTPSSGRQPGAPGTPRERCG